MKNIILVEDDAEAVKLLQYLFTAAHYNIVSCSTGNEAIQKIWNGKFDLIILDINLPDISGLEICEKIRSQGLPVPVIMLTSLAREADKVLAFDLGADDYITKPFSTVELLARVKALLRRADQYSVGKRKEILYKDMLIDIGKRKAMLRGDRLDLTHKEFDILNLLASNPGKTFSRSELLEIVWGESFAGYEGTITTHINRLRNKLEQDINKPEYILTSWGMGYRFPE